MDSKFFIKTLSKFDYSVIEGLDNDKWDHYCFDLNKVVDFNKSEEGYTTISLHELGRFTVAIKYEEFETLINEKFGIEEIIAPKIKFEFEEK